MSATLDLLICGAIVVTPTGAKPMHLGIAAGQIVELAPEIRTTSRTTVDATGLTIFPGVIDAHVHFNEPGRTAWEGITTGSAALVAGGGTCFFDMPLNSSPPTLDGASFDLKLAAAHAHSATDFALWGGLTPRNLDRLPELAERGVIGFKAFMSNSGIDDFLACDDTTLFHGMQVAAKLNLPVAVHAESDALTGALAQASTDDGRTSWRDYLDSRPVIAELEAIQRAMLLAAEAGCRLHIVHISHPRGFDLVRRYRSISTVDVTAETCPHYLLLNEQDLIQQGAAAKCAPPLRPEQDRQQLVAAVQRGEFDTIGSDHSPAPADLKTSSNAFAVWGGISGVQLTLRSLLTLGIEPSLIAQLTASRVAERFRLPHKGQLAVGFDADFSLVDTRSSAVLEQAELRDRHRQSPYLGRRFNGEIRATYVRGQLVFDGQNIRPGMNQLIRPMRD